MTSLNREQDSVTATGFGGHLLSGFIKANGAMSGVIALLIGLVLSAILESDAKVPVGWVVAAGVVVSWMVAGLLRSLHGAVAEARMFQRQRDLQAPKHSACAIIHPYPPYNSCSCILVIESTGSAFAAGSMVLISLSQDTHEKPLGYGTARGTQSDGRTVVTLDFPHDGNEEIIAEMLLPERRSDMVKRVRVVGSIHLEQLQNLNGPTTTNPTREHVPEAVDVAVGTTMGGGQGGEK